MFYEIWKARSLVLNEETDQLYELNKQQEDEIKELISWRLNFKLKKILVLISSTLSVLDCKNIWFFAVYWWKELYLKELIQKNSK